MATQQPYPTLDAPMVDPDTGYLSLIWSRFFLSMWNRTGGATGNDSAAFAYPTDNGNSGQVLTSQGGAPTIWTTLKTALGQFNNDVGYITSDALDPYSTSTDSQQDTETAILNSFSDVAPSPNAAVGNAGIADLSSRADHVHPRETAPVFSSVGVGSVTWTSGNGAPAAAQPNGSLYSRADGSTGSRLYISNGTTWAAVAAV